MEHPWSLILWQETKSINDYSEALKQRKEGYRILSIVEDEIQLSSRYIMTQENFIIG